MATKRKLKAKISRLKHALRKSEIDMRLLRSDLLVDTETLSYNLHFSQGQVRSLMRDNRILGEQVQKLTAETETVSVVIPIGTTLEEEISKDPEEELETFCQLGEN